MDSNVKFKVFMEQNFDSHISQEINCSFCVQCPRGHFNQKPSTTINLKYFNPAIYYWSLTSMGLPGASAESNTSI